MFGIFGGVVVVIPGVIGGGGFCQRAGRRCRRTQVHQGLCTGIRVVGHHGVGGLAGGPCHGRLVGQVRGQVLFEQQAFEISAQAGAMVGVEKEERLATPLWRSFRFRNPWLLVNLLTVFVAAAVVGRS